MFTAIGQQLAQIATGMPHYCHNPECDKTANKVCSACRSVYYCQKECQRQDWPAHKIHCASLKTVQEGIDQIGQAVNEPEAFTAALRKTKGAVDSLLSG